MTINYLKQFEPGDPIDINVLNKLIQNVNYLSTQIAQIYKLPAVQAPSSSADIPGGTTNPIVSGNKETIRVQVLANKISFKNVGQTLFRTLSKTSVEAITKRTVSSYKIISAGYSNPMFVPATTTDENKKKTATGCKLRTFNTTETQFSFVPAYDGTEKYNAGVNAPKDSGSVPNYYLWVDFELTVEVTY